MMKKNLGLIAALVAALMVVVFTGCPYPTNGDVTLEGRIVEPEAWKNAKGLTDEISTYGSATLDKATGTIGLTAASSVAFTVKLPAKTNASGSKKIKIKYIGLLKSGAAAKLTVKKDGTWSTIDNNMPDDTDAANAIKYPTFTTGAEATFTIDEKYLPNEATAISFQRNGDDHAFKLKILDVKLE